MKSKICFVVLLLGLSLLASGQNYKGGVIGGINACQIDNDGFSGFNKLGLSAGAFVGRELVANLSWQMEIKYSTRGMYHHPTILQPHIEISTMRYVELPLYLQYLYNDKIEIELGLAPDVLLGTRYEDENGLLDPSQAPDLRRFGINLVGGVNYFFIENMSVGLRYTYSAIPFFPFDYIEYFPRYRDRGYFHDVLNVSVKYYFLR